MHQLALTLEGFSEALMGNLQRFIRVEDTGGVETIWTCCVICLAHLAALSHLTSQTEPTLRDSMNRVCELTLRQLANLSHEARIEEYSHFDALTGVRSLAVLPQTSKALTKDLNQISWKRALETIDIRIKSKSHADSESLRHWRVVIWKAYADLQTNSSGYGPNSLVSSVLSADGRMEGSRYPNLLLADERERYGL